VAVEGQTSAKAGRCANHPAVASVGACDMCGRSLCLSCAVPIRGKVIGPECLSKVLVDAPPPPYVPAPIGPAGRTLALIGFAVYLVTSVFPWSRFGDSSRFFGAWVPHWSLVGVGTALLGLAYVLIDRLRPLDPRVLTAGLFACAVVASVAAFLHHHNPPLLSESTNWPWLALGGAILAFVGASMNLMALLRVRRAPA
jgi:hypothetical protein